MTPRDKTAQPHVCAALLTAILALLAVAAACGGCTRKEYVPVESVRTEYRDREVKEIVADTVRDTRLVWVRGDTVVDIREKERIRRVETHDTCYIERTHRMAVPYPVERRLTRWERVKMDFGGMAIGGIALALAAAVVWLARRFRR